MMPLRASQSVFAPAGPQAAHIASLGWYLIGTTTIVGLIVWIAIAIALKHGGSAQAPHTGPDTERKAERAIYGALTLTILILASILVFSFHTGQLIASLSTPSAVTIEVTGHQFWWEVNYDDAEPAKRVVTANEIHIPVGHPIVLKVTSRDVIHSFWVPMLHGKRDLIPGYTTAVWLRADRPGLYQGQCAEFCGRQHAHMAFKVIAEDDNAFAAWRARQLQPAAEPATDQQRHGRDLFVYSRCSGCHTITGTPAGGRVGPDLTHVGSRPTIGAGTLPNAHDTLARWIANPQLDKPGSLMPPNPMTAGDLADLVAYMESLK